MTRNELLLAIENSSDISALQSVGALPEPYDDSGYYCVYYSEEDYKSALTDIVSFIDDGLRIYYDRYLERGEAHRQDFLAKVKSIHTRCVVFYLSESCFLDETFLDVATVVAENNIPFISINLPTAHGIESGARMAERVSAEDRQSGAISRIFADEITYVPYTLPYAEKLRELKRAYQQSTMHFAVIDGYAVAEYALDLAEEEIVIPASVELQGVAYPVRAVGAFAFAGCRSLKSVSFPDTVEDIGFGASDESRVGVFDNCESLKEIKYPPRVKKLYGGMFTGCSSLSSLILSDGIEFVGLPNGTHFNLNAVGGSDLSGEGERLADVDDSEIPTVATIESLHLPECCKVMFYNPKEGYVRFTYPVGEEWQTALIASKRVTGGSEVSVYPHHKVTSNAELYFFGGNDSLISVDFDDDWFFGEKWIRVFKDCKKLETVRLPSTIMVTEELFSGCESLRNMYLPDSVEAINNLSFVHCKSLEEIRLPRHLCYVDSGAFIGAKARVIVSDSDYSKRILSGGFHQPYDFLSYSSRAMRWIMYTVNFLVTLFTNRKEFKTDPFYIWSDTEIIYVTERVRPFKLFGFEEVESDREGYRKYRCTLSPIDKLKIKGNWVKRK